MGVSWLIDRCVEAVGLKRLTPISPGVTSDRSGLVSEKSVFFVGLRKRISGEEFLDAAFRDDAGGIVIRVIRVSAVLTDKFDLRGPVVRGSECAHGTLIYSRIRILLRKDGADAVFPRKV